MYCSLPLERRPLGKHTVAVPNVKAFRQLISKTPFAHRDIYIGTVKKCGILPEGDEICALVQ